VDYTDLDRLIDRLQRATDLDHPQKGYWKELWALVGEIRAGFREVQYPTIQDKSEAQNRLHELIAQAKSRGEREKREREERQRGWEQKRARSQQALGRVQSRVAGARPIGELERMVGTLVLAPLLALESLLRSVLGLEELDEIHEDLKKCSAALRDAWQTFTDAKEQLLPADKQVAYQQLSDAQARLNGAWDAWRAAKNRAHDERRRAREEQQRQWEARQSDRRDRIRANIQKLEGKLEKAEDALERRKHHLSKLEDDYENARSDGFRDRCSRWIDEERDRIRDIEDSIDRIRGWLQEEHDKLRR
jgi:hypothetical protein